MYPSGDGEGQGNSLSLYVVAVDVKPYDKIYLKAKLRIINQRDSKHMEKKGKLYRTIIVWLMLLTLLIFFF